MAPRKMEEDDWRALRFEVGSLFTPSTPITTAELFAGRQSQILKLLDVVGERGRHAIIYGEPGVGKTSSPDTRERSDGGSRETIDSNAAISPLDFLSKHGKN